MNQQNDRVIKVKNVFAYIRKYIALVIVLALCGAVGLAGLCYLKNKREIDAEQSQTPVELEDMYEEFSETEKRISHMHCILMIVWLRWSNIWMSRFICRLSHIICSKRHISSK